MPRPSRAVPALTLAALLLPLAACGADGGAGTSDGSDDERIRVVASTDVYGDLAATVGGDAVEVTSLIDRPDQDPHSYEATARDRLAVSKADVVIRNGGGYDPFMTSLLDADHADGGSVIDAVEISGLETSEQGGAEASSSAAAEEGDGHDDGHGHAHGAFNEHVWYSLPAAARMVAAIEDRLAAERPADAATFTANATALTERITALQQRLSTLHAGAHRHVAVTEPVPLYLLQDAGLHDVTPPSFSAAIEEGTDVSPADLNTMRTLMRDREVALLAYNGQAESEQTRSVASLAKSAGVPVVDFTETLPDGKHYADWMADNISAVESALRTAR